MKLNFASFRALIGFLVCAVSFLVGSSAVYGQAQARLTGTIADATGAVIPGAQLTARNIDTGIVTEVTTNEGGTYNFPFLAPGRYSVSVTAPGFKTYTQSGVVLDTGFVRTINVQLELGEVSETVEVTARAPLLESETSSIGQLIEQASVINMPLESRRSASLVRLMGGVVFNREAGAEQAPQFSMFGGRGYNQMWQLDGGVAQNMTMGVAMLSINPPAESLQEFKVEANNYAAEYGRAGGGLILMTTKSGTNEFHGTAYEYLRNDAFDARDFFADEKAKLRYNIFGASIGGPIKRDKAFFFFNYEGGRRRDGVTVSGRTVPRAAERMGDFSARTDKKILDPLNGQPFPNNIIPQNRLDPIALKFMQFYPEPNRASDPTTAARANFVANTVDKLTQNFYTGRADYTIGTNDRVFGKYSFVEAPQEVGAVFPVAAADERAGPRENKNHHLVTSWMHNFSPTTISEVRWTFMRRLHINRGAGTGTGLNGELGVQGVNPDALARVTITNYTNLGQNNHERIQVPIVNNQFIYNLTKIAGGHTLKMGGDYRRSRNTDDQNAGTGGRFNFTDRATNDGLATFLLGWTTNADIIDTQILTTRSDYYALFIQDDWKVTPKFTLNLGLRWEMDQPRWEAEGNRQSGFAFDPINPISGTPGIVTFAGRDGQSRYGHDFDKNNFGPRFGFAWRARESTVVRGGYGIQYLGAYKSAVPNCCALGFALDSNFTSPDGGFTPAFQFNAGMPPATTQAELGPGFGAVPVGGRTTTTPEFFQQDHMNGYMQQWNLTLQQQVGFNSVVELAYIANVGHKLAGNDISYNMIPLVNGQGPARQDQTLRPFPQYSGLNYKSPPWGNSTYHALNAKWEKRYSNGLNFLANYTYSKFIDDVEANSEAGGTSNNYTHIELRRLDKALSGNDIRNRLVASSVYELPWGPGRRFTITNGFADALLGGWGLGGVVELRDGLPYGVVEQTNRTNTFSASVRPILVGDPHLSTDRPRAQLVEEWFNTEAFASPPVGVFGNAARAYCCGPGFVGIDLSLHKWFTFTERTRLMFRTDFYNLPNRPNFDLPNTNNGNSNFGRITSTASNATPRRIQFSLKLEF